MEKAGLWYARTVHLDWPEPLDGNEHGDVEYRLLREDWLPAAPVDLCATTATQPPRRRTPAIPGSAKSRRHDGPGRFLDRGQLRGAAE